MAGQQSAQNGKCPEGYTHVFGPLCIEQTTLSKIDEAIPDLPDVDFTDPSCEAAIAALKSVANTLQQVLDMPQKLMGMARELIERPFDAAEKMVSNVLGIFDELEKAIDDVLSGPMGALGEFKQALEKMLACPFIADTPIGKAAAALLDAIDDGLPIDELLQDFKGKLKSAVKEQINAVKDMPLSALSSLDKLFNDMLERFGVEDLIKKVRDLYKCVEAVCDMVKVAKRLPKSAEGFLESINGTIDETTGKLKAAVVKTANKTEQAAKDLADSIAVIKLAGAE
jgi:uncharacterized protein YjbJ (UPF0337 family)